MIVLDIETSSTDPYKGSILSIWAVELENPKNTFYGESRVENNAEVQDWALEVNGFTRKQIADPEKQSVHELLVKFIAWYETIEERTVWGHNVGYFDLRFIEVACTRYNLGTFGLTNGNYRSIDLHTLGYSEFIRRGMDIPTKNGLSSLSMDSVLALAGLYPEPKPHNALNGARLEAEAIGRILHSQNSYSQEFEMCRDLHTKQWGCNWGKCDSCGAIPLLHKMKTGKVIESANDIRTLKDSIFKNKKNSLYKKQ